jgi:acetyltransferase-like isoleucine patch superfamily enzyme
MAMIVSAVPAVMYHLLANILRSRRDDVFQGFTQMMSLIPGLPGDFLRRSFLWMSCRRCSMHSSIGFGTIFASPDIVIERGVYIGPLCSIGHVEIGRDTMIGTGVHLIGGARAHGTQRLDVPMKDQPRSYVRIHVGADCWIGNAAVVMADVDAHAIVGAGAVVTKRVAEWNVVAGNPARHLRDRREGAGADPRSS